MANDDTIVELEGVNGEWVTIAGPNAGDWGMYLGEDVKGAFYDPPVKVVYEEPGDYPGARYLSHRILRREITFPIIILNDKRESQFKSWMSRDSFLRKMFAYDRPAKIHVTTPESGHRWMYCRLGDEGISVDMRFDPTMDSEPLKVAVVTLVAGDPFWYEDDVIYPATTLTDTRFTPNIFSGKLPQETLHITVDPYDGRGGLNPTDQYIWLVWSVPGATEAPPSLPWPFPPNTPIPWEQAPYTQYTIPDYSFEDPEFENRRLKTPGLIIGEDCIINTDPREEQFSSASGSQVWARTNGVRFRHPVPPYTRDKDFEITVSGVAAGQTIELRIPRPWSRPWGLE